MALVPVINAKTQRGEWEANWIGEGSFLAVGSLGDAQDVNGLREAGVTHVLTVASRLNVWTDGENEGRPPEGISYLQVDLDDHPEADIFAVLPSCLTFLRGVLGEVWPPPSDGSSAVKTTRGAVLVHCASGISRSVSVIAAYLMAAAGVGYDDALRTIRETRPYANPNLGFQYKLRLLERTRGDVVAASKLLEEELERQGGEKITDIMIRQRQTANDLHSQVDEIEERLAAFRGRSREGPPRGHAIWTELQTALDALDRENSRAEGFVDKPAAAIRRSACAKATRLFSDADAGLNNRNRTNE